MVVSMRHNPKPQELYRHFKGNLYQIRCLAKHSETGEIMVVYQAMYDTFETYVRPLSMFMEEVDRVKYPDAKQKYRFELLQDIENENGEYDAEGYSAKRTTVVQTAEESEPELNIDPLVVEFLDAGTYEQRLNILYDLHNRITDDMINTMAVAVDLEIKEGDIEERYEELKNCLLTFEKYECNRLR